MAGRERMPTGSAVSALPYLATQVDNLYGDTLESEKNSNYLHLPINNRAVLSVDSTRVTCVILQCVIVLIKL